MTTTVRAVFLLALSSTSAYADLPVCPVEPEGSCPALDLHFTNEMLDACARFQEWEDCFIDEESGITGWFWCDAGAINMRERCTDTCGWQALAQVETCDELVALLMEQVC